MNLPITVVMSTKARNYGDEYCSNLLKRAIDSVLSQTFKDFEFIIVDDASTDGTAEILKQYQNKDSRVKIITHSESCGGITAKRYNEAVKMGQGDWFALMADDDEWMPHLLETLYMTAQDQKLRLPAIVYGQAQIIRTQVPGSQPLIMGHPWGSNIMRYNFVPNLAVLVKRDTYVRIGGGDENPKMRRYSDWDLWRRVWQSHLPAAFVPIVMARVYEGKTDGLRRTVEAVEFDDYMEFERMIPDMSCLKR